MKIAFFVTWDFSANILKSLISDFNDDLEIWLVVSQPDKPVWRKKILEKTQTKIVAEENNIKILQPEKLKPSPQPSAIATALLYLLHPCSRPPKGEGAKPKVKIKQHQRMTKITYHATISTT